LQRSLSSVHVEIEVTNGTASSWSAFWCDATTIGIVHDGAVLHHNALTAIAVTRHEDNGVGLAGCFDGIGRQEQMSDWVVGAVGITVVVGVL